MTEPESTQTTAGHNNGGEPFVLRWVRRALTNLRMVEEKINQLNVFPIPDADTGTNMVSTLTTALRSAESVKDSSGADVVAALAAGAVRGARGNSGMALSQILRAVTLQSSSQPWSGQELATCLEQATEFVENAIVNPVQGTIITVLQASAQAACQAVGKSGEQEPSVLEVLDQALGAAQEALTQTTEHLDPLRRAGVVDAGGYGLVVILQALQAELQGAPSAVTQLPPVHPRDTYSGSKKTHPGEEHAQSGELLEIMFSACGHLEELTTALETLGSSLVIAPFGTEGRARIHIHTDQPGQVLETAYSITNVTELHIETLPALRHILIAIVPPGQLSKVFEETGAVVLPPTEDVPEQVSALLQSGDTEALFQSNGLLTRAQIHRICTAHPQLRVLPTASLVKGIAALAVFDPEQPLNLVALAMADAAANMRTISIDRDQESYVVRSAGRNDESYDSVEEAVDRGMLRLRALSSIPPELLTVVVAPELSEVLERVYTERLHGDVGDVDIITYISDTGGHCVQIGVE